MFTAIADQHVTLTVRDFGRGMPAELPDRFNHHGTRLGVGLSGMRERVNDLGGQLDIRSDQHGTTVVVTVPMGGAAPDADLVKIPVGFGKSSTAGSAHVSSARE